MVYSNQLSLHEGVQSELERNGPSLKKLIRGLSRPLSPIPTGVLCRLDPLEGIKVVLFDIYGTLLISASGEVGSLRATAAGEADRAEKDDFLPFSGAVRYAGYEITTGSEDFNRRAGDDFTGFILEEHSRKKKLGYTSPEVDILSIWFRFLSGAVERGDLRGPEPDSAVLVIVSLHYELISNRVWPMPGVVETLKGLCDLGLFLGIVSNAQYYTPLILESLFGAGIESLGFDGKLIEWSYIGGRAKPSQAIFGRVLEELNTRGISAEEVLYVGNDMLNDVFAAGQSGCRTCLFAGDARSLRRRNENPRLHSCRPDAIISHLTQLPGLLQRGNGRED